MNKTKSTKQNEFENFNNACTTIVLHTARYPGFSFIERGYFFSHWLKEGVINLEYHTAVYSVYGVFAATIAKKRFIKYL